MSAGPAPRAAGRWRPEARACRAAGERTARRGPAQRARHRDGRTVSAAIVPLRDSWGWLEGCEAPCPDAPRLSPECAPMTTPLVPSPSMPSPSMPSPSMPSPFMPSPFMPSLAKASRFLGWLMLAALVVVTVCPIGLRPVSGAPVSLERFGAFALLGFLFALGYPHRRWQVAALTVAAAGSLEALQMLEPTRHGRVADFLVKMAGCGFGATLALGATLLAAGTRSGPARRG